MIRMLEHSAAAPVVEKWHYSKCVPKGSNTYFGWYDNDSLYAVADYGIGVNPYQASYFSRLLDVEIANNQLVELKRLVRCEPQNAKLPLTKFLSRCHRTLKKNGVRLVVSFSDPQYGHNGGIYRAANFTHAGHTQAEYHTIDEDGTIRHRRYAYRYAKRKGISTPQAREELGLQKIKTLPKDRWYIWINK